MKKVMIISCLLLGFVPAFALHTATDTIDSWTVSLNKKVLARLISEQLITLKSTGIKSTDEITVYYSSDAPCADCNYKLIVNDLSHPVIISETGKGTHTPLHFSLAKLIELKKTTKRDYFEIFYLREGPYLPTMPYLIFKLKIE